MVEKIVKLELGCTPEAAVSGPLLIQTEYSTFLVFNAMRKDGERYVDAGKAVVAFRGCSITKFGYPNDEAWFKIPRTRDLSYGIYEVLDSDWKNEIFQLNKHGFPNTKPNDRRHFLFLFHDSAFECVALDMTLRLSSTPIAEILAPLLECAISA